MKHLFYISAVLSLCLFGTGCRDSTGSRDNAVEGQYRISQPAPEDVSGAAAAFLASCEHAGIPLRQLLVSTPDQPYLHELLGHPVHPSVHSWYVWMDSLGLPEQPRKALEMPPGGMFLSRRGVKDVLAQTSQRSLGARGFEGSKLVPIAGVLTFVSVECDPRSARYGAVVASSERGWNGAQFFPSLVAYLNFLRACVLEEALAWNSMEEALVVDFQKLSVIERELGIASSYPEELEN